MQFVPAPREGLVPLGDAELYYREVGQGQPIIVAHGGPDFDHSYLLPDLDSLSDSYRLIYYDQRGRGRSARNVLPEDVTIESEVEDLERLREYLGLESIALLGHSWGGLLALEYAVRYTQRVSHLILMNTAPASHEGYMLMREELTRRRAPGDADEMRVLSISEPYKEGDPDTVADYYRIHFRPAVRQPEQLERVVGSLRSSFTKEGILKARAIEDRLRDETWLSSSYDLLLRLIELGMPALVIHGDYDFIPLGCVSPIVGALPGARLILLSECGHFSYMEWPDDVRREINDLFQSG
jgi:proline iminopeptidase